MKELTPSDFLRAHSIEDATQSEMIYLGPIGQEAMRRAGCSPEEIRKAATPTPHITARGFRAEFRCDPEHGPDVFALFSADPPLFECDLVNPITGSIIGTFDWLATAVGIDDGEAFVRAKSMGGAK